MNLLADKEKASRTPLILFYPQSWPRRCKFSTVEQEKLIVGWRNKTSKGRKLLNVWKVNNLYSLYNFFQWHLIYSIFNVMYLFQRCYYGHIKILLLKTVFFLKWVDGFRTLVTVMEEEKNVSCQNKHRNKYQRFKLHKENVFHVYMF